MKASIRTKLVLSFLAVIAISGIVTVWTGVHMIGNEIIAQAQDKVRLDLNSAREVYARRMERITDTVRLTSIRFFLREGLLAGRQEAMAEELERIRESEGLDFLTLTDGGGAVVVRARNPGVSGDSQREDDVVGAAMAAGKVVAATQVLPRSELIKEGNALAEQADIEFVETPMARPSRESRETAGMVIKAAAPVFDHDGTLIGVLYGGNLLNRDYRIVDEVKEMVYQGETYKGRDIGTVTIFQNDLRISTNVLGADGERAIGTRVSEEVYDRTIVAGMTWIDRAFVVNDWYITAYAPLADINGEIVGMLYVGMLEGPYLDLRNRVAFTFAGIAVLTFGLLSAVLYFATSNIIKPLRNLLEATEKVARGYLAFRVQVTSDDEVGQLARSFNSMTEELESAKVDYAALTQNLEERVRERTRELEDTQEQLIQSEKVTSLGKMAAGIAHEINNPLTSILINSHLLAENVAGDGKPGDSLNLIIEETERCSKIVKGLLDFSRQATAEKVPTDLNQLIEDTLTLVKSHVMASKTSIVRQFQHHLPVVSVAPGKIKQVFTNLILNAIEAMPGGGVLTLSSRTSDDGKSVEIEFADAGCGIPEHIIRQIFDPFFSTKKGKGTGLGLSISYGIVKHHGGDITVQSSVGKGTEVTVTLPITVEEGGGVPTGGGL